MCVYVCVGGGVSRLGLCLALCSPPNPGRAPSALSGSRGGGEELPPGLGDCGFPTGDRDVGKASPGLGIQVTSYPSYIQPKRSGIQATYSMRDSPCGDKIRL